MEVEGRKGSHGVKLRSKKERVRGMGRGSTSINALPVCSRSLLATAGKRPRTHMHLRPSTLYHCSPVTETTCTVSFYVYIFESRFDILFFIVTHTVGRRAASSLDKAPRVEKFETSNIHVTRVRL